MGELRAGSGQAVPIVGDCKWAEMLLIWPVLYRQERILPKVD